MSRKKSDEVRMTEYFESADQAKVEVVYEIVKGIMRKRNEVLQRIAEAKGERTKPQQKRKRRTKAEMEAAKKSLAQVAEAEVPF